MPEEDERQERHKKIKRGLVLGAQYNQSGYGISDREMRAYLDYITSARYAGSLRDTEIDQAIRYIEWYAKMGSIPPQWQKFLDEHNEPPSGAFYLKNFYTSEEMWGPKSPAVQPGQDQEAIEKPVSQTETPLDAAYHIRGTLGVHHRIKPNPGACSGLRVPFRPSRSSLSTVHFPIRARCWGL